MKKRRDDDSFDSQFNKYSALSAAVDKKALEIFASLVGQRAGHLTGLPSEEIRQAMIKALGAEHSPKVAEEVAFHMLDWSSDAALLLAIILYPERFTSEEINVAIRDFLTHVPYHVDSAARLVGAGPATEPEGRRRQGRGSR